MKNKKHIRYCSCGCGNTLKLLFTKGKFKGYSGKYSPNCPNRENIIHRPCPKKGHYGMNHPKALPLLSKKIVERHNKKYIMIKINESGRWLYEHRYIMQKHLNRKLNSTENIHHINGDGLDNRIENLMILFTKDHNKHHFTLTNKWSIHYDSCIMCNETSSKHSSKGICSKCYQRIRYEKLGHW